MSQKSQILNLLRGEYSLTAMNAVRLFGCYRLAARIAELREDGHDVRTRMESKNGKRYARYVLRGGK